jgi:hypothetical protein
MRRPNRSADGEKHHGLQILANHFVCCRWLGANPNNNCVNSAQWKAATVRRDKVKSIAAVASAVLAGSCGAAQTNAATGQPVAQAAPAIQGTTVTDQQLPINQRFRNLDEYLAWLRKTEEPVDGGWYKEIRPGVYELQTSGNLHLDVPANEQRVFTREELERKFGFKS